jgi:lysophospholipase L1-like esterase
MRTILFIGDSLIEYFDWAGRFPAHDVFNLGVSGETVEWLVERVPRITTKHPSADLIFIQSGINNVAMEDSGVLSEYREVVRRLKSAYPNARVYITSLLPTLLPFISPEEIVRLNGLLQGLAQESSCAYLNVHDEFVKGDLPTLLSMDGIHLSQKGYEVWADVVEKVIDLQ